MPELPDLDLASFAAELAASRPERPGLDAGSLRRLHAHYLELRRWAPRIDLIGPGAAPELFARHYAEALDALPWLPRGPFRLVDVGSGAGFPGFVIGAARPDAELWLVEPRQRRLAFLAAAARRAGLEARCLGARVAAPLSPELPKAIDVVTIRALRLPPRDLAALAAALAPEARLLVWEGSEPMPLPGALRPGRRQRLPGSAGRYLAEYLPDGGAP